MKRLFSKKSGFSLAEIIVAIAIFSIMMAMIMQMLRVAIDQRNNNLAFAKDVEQQEVALKVNGKNTEFPKDPSGNPIKDDTIRLNFVNPSAPNPTDPIFKNVKDSDNNVANGIPIDYGIKGTKTDVNEGLNYFVGNYDYDADGTGGSDGSPGSASQTAQYDTRITGSKGLKNITISECSKTSSVPGYSGDLTGKTVYKMTVKANSGSMQKDDKKYSQMRFYFYSSDEYDIKKITKTKLGADGKPIMKADGKTPETEEYFKKVFKKAEIIDVVADASNAYTVQKSSDYAIRIGLPIGGANNDKGFEPSNGTTFYLIFSSDPKISPTTFGDTGSSTYNCANIYEEKTGVDTGKDHVNIYGVKKFEVHDKKEDFK